MSFTARDIMVKDVYCLLPTMSVIDMDAELLKRKISGAPVVSSDGALVGVVSRSDIARKLSGEIEDESDLWSSESSLMAAMLGANQVVKPAVEHLRQLCVQDIMVTNAISVSPEEGLKSVAKVMVNNKIHRVLVVEEGKLVGLISSLDLVAVFAET